MSDPHGATVVQPTPNDPIELMLWWSGEEPIRCELTKQQALILAAQLINSVVSDDGD